MKRLLFIKQEIRPKGGLEKYSRKIVRAFVEKDCDVTVLTATPDISSFEGAKVECLPLKGFFGFAKLRNWDETTKAYAAQHSFDLSFTLDRVTCPTHLRAGNGVHAAYLKHRRDGFFKQCSFRINPLHRTLLGLEKAVFDSTNLRKIIVNSEMVCEEVQGFYGVDPSRIAVHHNGVEWQEMASEFSQWKDIKAAMQKELSLPKDAFLFLFAGHHYRRKGLDYVLHALATVKEGHLLVVGKDKQSSYYQRLVRHLRLENRVSFLGPRSDMNNLYALADALVVPSLYDPFANVTVEALAMGLFVISSPFNGGKEVLNATSGVTIEDLFDRDSVKNALQKALIHPKTLMSAEAIRNQYASLDFSLQLPRLIKECLT